MIHLRTIIRYGRIALPLTLVVAPITRRITDKGQYAKAAAANSSGAMEARAQGFFFALFVALRENNFCINKLKSLSLRFFVISKP
jgi:hypothetical protein